MTDYDTSGKETDDAPIADQDPFWSDDQFRATGRYEY